MKMFEFVRNFYRKSYREGDINTCMQNDPLASTYNFAIYFYNEIYCLLKRYRDLTVWRNFQAQRLSLDPNPSIRWAIYRRGNERQRGNEAKQLLWNVISPLTGIYPARQEAVLCGRSSEGEGGEAVEVA